MAANKTVGTNPLKLPWPSDRSGIAQKLQREGCRAIGRMAADPANYEMIMEVLRILAAHAAEKLENQKLVLADQKVKAARQRKSAQDVASKGLEAQAKTLRKQRASLDAKIKTLEAA